MPPGTPGTRMGTAPDEPGEPPGREIHPMKAQSRLVARAALASALAVALAVLSASATFAGMKFP